MEKKRFRWGWIPLIGLLLLPALWWLLQLSLLTGSGAGGSASFVGVNHYIRLFLQDSTFITALINTLLPAPIVGGLVAVVAMLVKKSLWDGQNHPHSQGWFYGVTGGVLFVVLIAAVFTSTTVTAMVGYPSDQYAAETIISHLEDGTSAPYIALNTGHMFIGLFLTALFLLLIYIADLVIPARKQPVTAGFARGFSVAHLLLCVFSGGIFFAANIGMWTGLPTTEENPVFSWSLVRSGEFWFSLICMLLLITELVLGIWFLVKGSRWNGFVFAAVSLVSVLGMWFISPQRLAVPLYRMLRFGPLNLIDTPLTWLVGGYALIHLLALLCGVVAVWLRWLRKDKVSNMLAMPSEE